MDSYEIDRASGDSLDEIASAGSLLSLIAAGKAQSRAELIERSGLSRTTVTQRLNALLQTGFVEETQGAPSTGGRPTRMLRLRSGLGVVLVADVGETVLHTAVANLKPAILAESIDPIDFSGGPLPVLRQIVERFRTLLEQTGQSLNDVLGACLCVRAPADFESGLIYRPSLMIGWEDVDARGWLSHELGAPVFVENDVNLTALAEWRQFWPDTRDLLFIKAGTGIGSGIITGGALCRGSRGLAGEIGHIQLNTADPPLCRCGKLGCIEARASGWALARDLRAEGFDVHNARGVVSLVSRDQPEAILRVRDAGRAIGDVVSIVICVLNPSVVVVGGTLSTVDEHLLAGIRQSVFERSLPITTRGLEIARARTGANGSILGGAQLTIDTLMREDAVEETILRWVRQAKRAT